MTHDSSALPPMFRIDVSADASSSDHGQPAESETVVALLKRIVVAQERQSQLLEEMNQQLGASQRQRASELTQWREANPQLSAACRTAAEVLGRVQSQFLEALTEEVADNEECLLDGEFMLNEFVDRFGPRLAHLNGVLQVLSQLSAPMPQRTSN